MDGFAAYDKKECVNKLMSHIVTCTNKDFAQGMKVWQYGAHVHIRNMVNSNLTGIATEISNGRQLFIERITTNNQKSAPTPKPTPSSNATNNDNNSLEIPLTPKSAATPKSTLNAEENNDNKNNNDDRKSEICKNLNDEFNNSSDMEISDGDGDNAKKNQPLTLDE